MFSSICPNPSQFGVETMWPLRNNSTRAQSDFIVIYGWRLTAGWLLPFEILAENERGNIALLDGHQNIILYCLVLVKLHQQPLWFRFYLGLDDDGQPGDFLGHL